MREFPPTMHAFERLSEAFDRLGINRAEVGRELGITGQAVTLKLQGKRRITDQELQVFARWAGMTADEALGEDVVIHGDLEKEFVVKLGRVPPEIRDMVMHTLRVADPGGDDDVVPPSATRDKRDASGDKSSEAQRQRSR